MARMSGQRRHHDERTLTGVHEGSKVDYHRSARDLIIGLVHAKPASASAKAMRLIYGHEALDQHFVRAIVERQNHNLRSCLILCDVRVLGLSRVERPAREGVQNPHH